MLRKTAAAFFILLLSFSAVYANEKIIVAAFEYPPIYQNAENKGLSCEIVTEAFKAAGVDVDVQFYPVNRMINVVKNGEAVCGIGGSILFSAPDIAAEVRVSEPVQYVVQTFLYDSRKFPERITFSELKDMSRYRIGVLNGSGIMRFLAKTPELTLDKNTTHEGSAKQLQLQRIDLWAIVDLTGTKYMKELFPKEVQYYRYTKAYNLGDVSVVFSKKLDPDNAYNRRFMKGLAIIKKNGTYMRIMAKYYGSEKAVNRDSLTADMR